MKSQSTWTIQEKQTFHDFLTWSTKPFLKLVREIAYEMKENLRFQKQALDALLDASEAMLVNVFEDANLCTLHAGRVTLFPSDMKLARTLANHSVLQQI